MSNLLEDFKKHGPLLVFLAVIVVCIGYGYIIWSTDWTSNNKIGNFGESFGAIDALFAGLAFAVLIYTILLQKAELQLQRKELQEQRETLQKQNFESSFFQLLGLHSKTVNAMVIREGGKSSGRECFHFLLQELRLAHLQALSQNDTTKSEREVLNDTYEEVFFRNNQQYIGHYFSHLYNMVKFVDQSKIANEKFYTDLIYAQLSSNELGLLFYHGLCARRSNFKDLFSKHFPLKDVPPEVLIKQEHVDYYSASTDDESD